MLKELKDEALFQLSRKRNVANFASFYPEGKIRFQVLPENKKVKTLEGAIAALLRKGKVNIRSFRGNETGNPFMTGLDDADEIARKANMLMNEGFYIILNEDIPRHGRMASGVICGNQVEFAPCDTPRCVERECSCMPADWAETMLSRWLSARVFLPRPKERLEFSVYPYGVGARNGNVVFWERGEKCSMKINIIQPDQFSRHIGDKAWGLFLAWSARGGLDINIPECVVYKKGYGMPFLSFGEDTGSENVWTRTCPKVAMPGKYATLKGFHDPFKLMEKEDPTGDELNCVMIQREVNAKWSGAAWKNGNVLNIEGVPGFGDDFMLAKKNPLVPPPDIYSEVEKLLKILSRLFKKGVKIEWVFDGEKLWLVQMHVEDIVFEPDKSKVDKWIGWNPSDGLDVLREIIKNNPESGVILHERIGLSSHAADIIRKAKVPVRFHG